MHLQRSPGLHERHVAGIQACAVLLLLVTEQKLGFLEHESQREANVKGNGVVNLINFSVRQADFESGDVGFQVADLAAADDGVGVGGLVSDVGECLFYY